MIIDIKNRFFVPCTSLTVIETRRDIQVFVENFRNHSLLTHRAANEAHQLPKYVYLISTGSFILTLHKKK